LARREEGRKKEEIMNHKGTEGTEEEGRGKKEKEGNRNWERRAPY
jgi:hypothetical protein